MGLRASSRDYLMCEHIFWPESTPGTFWPIMEFLSNCYDYYEFSNRVR